MRQQISYTRRTTAPNIKMFNSYNDSSKILFNDQFIIIKDINGTLIN